MSQRIVYVQYTNPTAYPPLEHSSRILAREGWQVLFLGTGALGADALGFPPHARIEVRRMRFSPAGWRQKLHYLRFCVWVIFWRLRWRPHWIYASDALSCPIALVLSLLGSRRIIYHEHDLPESEVRVQKSEFGSQRSAVRRRRSPVSSFMRLVLCARKQLAKRAKLCVLPNEQRAERFALETGRPTVNGLPSAQIVWNCPSLEEIVQPRATHAGGDFWVLYHGSIVPSRLPRTVLSALSLLPPAVKLRVIGYETVGHKGYVEVLKESAVQLAISDRVEFVDAIPRSHLLKLSEQVDVGLALMPKGSRDLNQQAMVGASNKPFDYLACGLALLVSDLSDWNRVYVDGGYGLPCDPDDPHSIARALKWFLEHPIEMRRMGELGRKKIVAEWNYETTFKPVLKVLST